MGVCTEPSCTDPACHFSGNHAGGSTDGHEVIQSTVCPGSGRRVGITAIQSVWDRGAVAKCPECGELIQLAWGPDGPANRLVTHQVVVGAGAV